MVVAAQPVQFDARQLHGLAGDLPVLVQAPEPDIAPMKVFPALRNVVDRELLRCGGILFRGFAVPGAAGFREFAAAFGDELLSYEFGSTPRSNVISGVYTSTEYPAHQRIPIHNEQAYTREWPMRIWFCSLRVAASGGETPIADSREIYRRMPAGIRERFVGKGLMYVRNYGNGLDVAWQQVFNTGDRRIVEEYCRRHAIQCEWQQDGELRTRQRCQVVARHPQTEAMVWFNQAHLFHVSGLPPPVRESLLEVVSPDELPRNVYYGDGTPIEDSLLDAVRGVIDACTVSFPWQAGDILMLDNMLAAHARAAFTGERKVVVAMARSHRCQESERT